MPSFKILLEKDGHYGLDREIHHALGPDVLAHVTCGRMVGSRRTVKPAPKGADNDILVLAKDKRRLKAALTKAGWQESGSGIRDKGADYPKADFTSFRKGEYNVILTSKTVFFDKFMVATYLAKKFNLKDKSDRIALFQGVLYGNKV